MKIMRFLQLLLGYELLCMFSACYSPSHSKMSKDEAILIARQAVLREKIELNQGSEILAKEGSTEKYWIIIFIQPGFAVGGDITVFVDERTGKTRIKFGG